MKRFNWHQYREDLWFIFLLFLMVALLVINALNLF